MNMEKYDYIIAGAGCAGRSLAVHLMPYLVATGKSLLMIDEDWQEHKGKTWCFWETQPGIFESIVFKKWTKLFFSGFSGKKELDIHPYTYKMIRSVDFYDYTSSVIENSSSVTIVTGKIEQTYSSGQYAYVLLNGRTYAADYVFNSIPAPVKKEDEKYQYFLQHFKGWIIQTDEDIFHPAAATLMDFNTFQKMGTSFFYVLPLSSNKAMVEYTVFSTALLQESEYQLALNKYIRGNLGCKKFDILEEENGVIPMSDHPLPKGTGRIINIGTAGGFTKPSTGYTFRFIQKHCVAMVAQLSNGGHPLVNNSFPRRFAYYDGTLLRLLRHNNIAGKEIFSILFEKSQPHQLLKFLDNETSILQEWNIFKVLPKKKFLKALIERMIAVNWHIS
jgi:lycopene beta-cyclase